MNNKNANAKKNAVRNILLGNITLKGSCLTDTDMAYIVAACNAYKENPSVFEPSKKLNVIFQTFRSNNSHYSKKRCQFFYDVVKDMMKANETFNFDDFIIEGNAESIHDKASALKSIQEREKSLNDDYAELAKKMAEYEKQFALLIECQRREAKEYFDNYTPYKQYYMRRTTEPVRNRKYTNEEIIRELQAIYGDEYDYSEVDYKDSRHAINLICKRHNIAFNRTMANLRKGWGCPECNKEKGKTWGKDIVPQFDASRKNGRWTTERFVQESESIFGRGTFDYSLCQYVNNDTKVTLIYKATGEHFEEMPYDHLRQTIDHYEPIMHFYRGTTDEQKRYFIVKRIMDNVKEPLFVPRQHIVSSHKQFECICPTHGRFYLTLSRVYSGHGCPQCSGGGESIGERNVRLYLNAKGIAYKQEYVIMDKRYFPAFARVDFYLPKQRIFIEFQGEQHYGIGIGPIMRDGKTYEQQKIRDENMRKYTASHNITLIEVPYTYRDNVGEYLNQYLNG